MPKPAGEFDLADHGLAIGHQRQRAVEALDLGAGEVDAIELAFERAGIGRQLDGHEGTADAGARGGGFQLRHVEAEIGEDAAHAAHPQFDAFFDRGQRRHLAALDLVERGLQANQHVVDALNLGELVRLRLATTGARDSSRASRSGGATKITVSLIGDGFGVPAAASLAAAPRAGGLIEPVTATSGMAPSAVARDSSVVWRRMIWSSFWSNCSWSSNWRLVVRSTLARSSAMRSS